MKNGLFTLLFFISFSGCQKDEFNPVIGFQDKIVVMGILNNWSNTQFIKIQKMYPSQNSPDNIKTLKNLKVRVIENSSKVYEFSDTTIPGITNYVIYYNNNFKVTNGLSYSLQVTGSDFPTVVSYAIAPNPGIKITYNQDSIIINQSSVIFHSHPYYIVLDYHIYLKYREKIKNEVVEKNYEVPIKIQITGNRPDTTVFYYSLPKEKPTSQDKISITQPCLNYTTSKIYETAEKKNIQIIKCIITLKCVESNLCNYSFKGFNDSYSVRLDQPNWSNVLLGEGIFGIVTSDSFDIFVK